MLADDPALTVRAIPGRSPARVVLDFRLRTPTTAAILSLDAPTYLMTSSQAADQDKRRALEDRHIAVRHKLPGRGGVDISAVLRQLLCPRHPLSSSRGRTTRHYFIAGCQPCRPCCHIHFIADSRPRNWCRRRAGNGVAGQPLQLTGRSVHLVGDTTIVAADISSPAIAPASVS